MATTKNKFSKKVSKKNGKLAEDIKGKKDVKNPFASGRFLVKKKTRQKK